MPLVGSCCCGGTPGVCCTCTPAVNLRRVWNLTVPAIQNGICGFCSEYTGDFVLRWNTDCVWHDYRAGQPRCDQPCLNQFLDESDSLCCENVTWTLFRRLFLGNDEFILRTGKNPSLSEGAPTYGILAENWNCNAANVLTFRGDARNLCQAWPAQLTVTPSVETIPICGCWPPYDAIANEWRVEFNGFIGSEVCCQTPMNRNYVLRKLDPSCGIGVGVNCTWCAPVFLSGDPPPPCQSSYFSNIQLEFDGQLAVALLSLEGQGALTYLQGKWGLPLASFNPVGPNRLRLVGLDPHGRCGTVGGVQVCDTIPEFVDIFPN